MYKIFKYIAIAVGVVSVYFGIRLIAAGKDVVETSADFQAAVLSPFMYLTYVVLAVAVVLSVVFLFKDLFTGSNAKGTAIGLVGFAVLVLISFLLTSGEDYVMREGEILSATSVHWISAGIVMFYILGLAALALMFFGGLTKLMK